MRLDEGARGGQFGTPVLVEAVILTRLPFDGSLSIVLTLELFLSPQLRRTPGTGTRKGFTHGRHSTQRSCVDSTRHLGATHPFSLRGRTYSGS
jgi:hypothetical protein